MPRAVPPPEATTTWAAIAALRLERQHLARRAPRGKLLEVVRDHVAIQAQVMSSAELALNARIEGLRPDDVRDALWTRRTLVKTWAMRGTLHLVAAKELPELVGALANRNGWRTDAWLRYFGVTERQMEALLEAYGEVLGATPMTKAAIAEAVVERTGNRELGRKLASGWGTFLKPAAMRGLLVYGPDDGRNVTYVDPRQWLRVTMPDASDEALADVLERYVGVMPGVGRAELNRWWGAEIRPALPHLRDRLAEVDVEGDRTFVRRFDLKRLQQARGSMGILRLVGGFDPYVLGITRAAPALLPVARRALVSRTAGWISPAVLIDGVIAGTWTHAVRRGRLVIEVTPWRRLTATEAAGTAGEADRIGRFLGRPVEVERLAVLPEA